MITSYPSPWSGGRGIVATAIGSLLASSSIVVPAVVTVSQVVYCGTHCYAVRSDEVTLLSGVQIALFMLGGNLPGVQSGVPHHVFQSIYPPPVLALIPMLLPLITLALSVWMLLSARSPRLVIRLIRVIALVGIAMLAFNALLVVFTAQFLAASLPLVVLAEVEVIIAYTVILAGAFNAAPATKH